MPGSRFFRYNDPGNDIDKDARPKGEERYGKPDEPYHGRIDIEVVGKTGADPAEHPVPHTAIKPLHTDR